MDLPLLSRNARITARVRRSQAIEETGSGSSEAVSIWFGLGFPLVTFGFWLLGLLLFHPWGGFFIGLGLSLLIGSRLNRRMTM